MRWTVPPRTATHLGLLAGLLLVGASGARAAEEQVLPPPALPALPPPAARAGAGDRAPPRPEPAAPSGCRAPVPPIMELHPEPGADALPTPAAEALPPPSPWARVPPVRVFPRLGYFFIPPTGPGYYSLQDVLEHHARAAPPAFPYPPTSLMAFSFFDADFRYLERPDNRQHDWLDPLKRVHVGDNWLLSTGGEVRFRQMKEEDRQLSGRDNNYQLLRTRLYADLWFRDQFRAFVEYLDARTYNQDLPPLPIDVNQSELLNAFLDWKLGEPGGQPAYLRVGRQELLLGSERLISPLEWANTRRTFQGVRAFRQGERFDLDLFWVQPVVPDPLNLDSVDNDQNFAGLWTTYRPRRGTFFDLYYLFLDNVTPNPPPGATALPPPFHVSTAGVRYAGDRQGFLWDAEAMYQFGERGRQTTSAGACTGGLGYQLAGLPMNPQFWVYYDWASGDRDPGAGGRYTTFNQLFPFGHYYFGYLDLVGRQNIHDVSAQAAFYPARWVLCLAQFHRFRLDSARDALYNAAGVPIRRDPTGRAGKDVGEELDLLVNFHLGPHQDVLVGWSKLFAGEFIRQTGSPRSPELFYLQYQFRW